MTGGTQICLHQKSVQEVNLGQPNQTKPIQSNPLYLVLHTFKVRLRSDILMQYWLSMLKPGSLQGYRRPLVTASGGCLICSLPIDPIQSKAQFVFQATPTKHLLSIIVYIALHDMSLILHSEERDEIKYFASKIFANQT